MKTLLMVVVSYYKLWRRRNNKYKQKRLQLNNRHKNQFKQDWSMEPSQRQMQSEDNRQHLEPIDHCMHRRFLIRMMSISEYIRGFASVVTRMVS